MDIAKVCHKKGEHTKKIQKDREEQGRELREVLESRLETNKTSSLSYVQNQRLLSLTFPASYARLFIV
jgi:hypothetical protein